MGHGKMVWNNICESIYSMNTKIMKCKRSYNWKPLLETNHFNGMGNTKQVGLQDNQDIRSNKSLSNKGFS
jgi:hypothetical protein